MVRGQADVGEEHRDRLCACRRPPGRRGREPADVEGRDSRLRFRGQSRALHPHVRCVQRAPGLFDGRAGLSRGVAGREGGHHPPRREDALRDVGGDRAEDHGHHAQGVRRGLLRDVRQGLRTGRAGRVAVR